MRKTVSRRLVFIMIACLTASSCTDPITNPTVASPGVQANTSRISGTDILDLGRAVAVVLGDASLRRSLHADLRDSPFPQHRLHLSSYLAGDEGSELAASVAAELGIPLSSLLVDLNDRADLEIGMLSILDRVSWKADDPVLVASSSIFPKDFQNPSIRAFTSSGRALSISLLGPASMPVISILPTKINFGPTPELIRSKAPSADRTTISTYELEAKTSTSDCDPTTAVVPCEDDPHQDVSAGPALDAGTECNVYNVDTGPDADSDNLNDTCEERFALGFEPTLVFHKDESYSGREPYWVAQRTGINNQITIAYLIGYYYDGWPVSHHGDSEFILVRLRVADGDGNWGVDNVTLSAHWGACCGGDETRTKEDSQFKFSQSRPYVYVSKSHHANYSTESQCDDRAGDTCSSISTGLVQPLNGYANRDLGSSDVPYSIDPSAPAGCTYSKWGGSSQTAIECYFSTLHSGNSFAGWYHEDGTTHYKKVLSAWDFM